MHISRATATDLPQVVAISSDSLKSHHSTKYFKARLNDFFYCLREGTKIFGFIIVRNGLVDLVAVEKSQRRKGYGRVLLDMAIDEFDELTLKVRESNTAARHLYEKANWEKIGFASKPYKNGEKGIVYRRQKQKS